MDFAIPIDNGIKIKESIKRDIDLDLARKLKKKLNIKITVIPIVISAPGTIPNGLVQGLDDLEINRDHPNNNIIKIGQNTEKSPKDLKRLAVT